MSVYVLLSTKAFYICNFISCTSQMKTVCMSVSIIITIRTTTIVLYSVTSPSGHKYMPVVYIANDPNSPGDKEGSLGQ